MEHDFDYRQALIDEGYDPDDPRIRRALADTAAVLRSVAATEHPGSVRRRNALCCKCCRFRVGPRPFRHDARPLKGRTGLMDELLVPTIDLFDAHASTAVTLAADGGGRAAPDHRRP